MTTAWMKSTSRTLSDWQLPLYFSQTVRVCAAHGYRASPNPQCSRESGPAFAGYQPDAAQTCRPASAGPSGQRPADNAECHRLVHITQHAQSGGFQQAVIDNNAKQLYLALRDRIQSFDQGDRPSIWDARKDRRELQRTA
ncbi:unnamed protein product [Phytophthora lilii]|uniref:Unnamed protein product n=1 Tax=Phytophthora lilii TaxID=2077276 RepID=A0A9W6U5W6_9STRA|nr:unnamed protein product [Phytophthora lilii]